MSNSGPDEAPPVADAELHDWTVAAYLSGRDLVDALGAEADGLGGSLADIQAAARDREAYLAEFGECLSALASRPDWRDHVPADAADELARTMRDVAQAGAALERAVLAERAAHDVLVTHTREALQVTGDTHVYARTGVARRAPDGPIWLSVNGRH